MTLALTHNNNNDNNNGVIVVSLNIRVCQYNDKHCHYQRINQHRAVEHTDMHHLDAAIPSFTAVFLILAVSEIN